MKRLFNVMVLAFVVMLIVGCATPTPYQKADGQNGFGYSDYQVKDNIYQVTFTANASTDRGVAEQYFNKRAKDLCVEKGFQDYRVTRTDSQDPKGGDAAEHPQDCGSAGNPFNVNYKPNPQVSGSVECLKKSQ